MHTAAHMLTWMFLSRVGWVVMFVAWRAWVTGTTWALWLAVLLGVLSAITHELVGREVQRGEFGRGAAGFVHLFLLSAILALGMYTLFRWLI